MNILDKIVKHKLREIEDRKQLFPVGILEKSMLFESPTISIRKALLQPNQSGIIAEFKRQSPSRGIINANVSADQVSLGYFKAGVSALSVLTDSHFFGGSNEDLITARKNTPCPILRKDFILDEYQITEAKSIGADVILLIAAILNPQKLSVLANFAHTLGLEVLMEVHTEEELVKNMDAHVDLIGVNNRNLKTFEVSIENSKRIAPLIPDFAVKISESGIDNPHAIHELRKSGFKGFLIGEKFMQSSHPEVSCSQFIKELSKNNAV